MTILQRVGYYLGGFSIGLVILAFFLNGKNASCDYTPNARTVKNISSKKQVISEETKTAMVALKIDSLDVYNLIKTGSVNFSESDIDSEKPCNNYIIESQKDAESYLLKVRNCDSTATLESIVLKTSNQ